MMSDDWNLEVTWLRAFCSTSYICKNPFFKSAKRCF